MKPTFAFVTQRKPRRRKPLKVPRVALKECLSFEDLEALLVVLERVTLQQIDRYESLLRELCDGDRTVTYPEQSGFMCLWNALVNDSDDTFTCLNNFLKLVRQAIQELRDTKAKVRSGTLSADALREVGARYAKLIDEQAPSVLRKFNWIDAGLERHGLGDYSPRGPVRLKKGGSGK
ncbi:MAG TPA: hypothetical protein VGX94_12050 [Terriglobia bacterium]|nr:hypothetical protein [Terriglobia bacterium]